MEQMTLAQGTAARPPAAPYVGADLLPLRTSRISAIRAFFEADGGRKVSMDEFKALSGDDRKELGTLAAEKLGVTLKD